MLKINKLVYVLNKTWTPIGVVNIINIITKICNDTASIIDEDSYVVYSWTEWLNKFSFLVIDKIPNEMQKYDFINSAKLRIRTPKIVLLKHYSKLPLREVKLTRRNLLIRDDYTCQYTGKKLTASSATVDHVLPKSRGGRTVWNNLVICSKDANNKKSNKTPDECGLKLLRKPFKPKYDPFFGVPKKYIEYWNKFVNK
ncbi:MAG: HNH endonuclease [Phenylobacterium sp.]